MDNNKVYAVYYNGLGAIVFFNTIEKIKEHNENIHDTPYHIYKDKASANHIANCLCHLEDLEDCYKQITEPII